MTATVHHIRGAETDPLAELHAERDRLGQELQRFVVVDDRRNGSEAKIAEVDAALAAIDRADREAVERWAESAEGAPPEPLLAKRKALMARRLDAEAERQAAEVAISAVAAKRSRLIAEINVIGSRINERQVAAALDQGRRLHTEVKTLAAELCDKLMRLEALRQVLIEAQGAAVNKQDQVQAAIFRSASSEVEQMRLPEILADKAVVDRHAAAWREAIR